ncbi:hypothetical protein ACWDWU_12150 [Streptomyces sp. NPDC003442]
MSRRRLADRLSFARVRRLTRKLSLRTRVTMWATTVVAIATVAAGLGVGDEAALRDGSAARPGRPQTCLTTYASDSVRRWRPCSFRMGEPLMFSRLEKGR